MKIQNNIGWCDETTNAVTGCDKVSAGCKNCYAATGTRARVLRAQGIETWGVGGVRMPVAGFQSKIRALNKRCVCDRCHEAKCFKWTGTTHWDCAEKGIAPRPTFRRVRLFADSNSDWLDEKWPIGTFKAFLQEVICHQNIDILLLTKRPQNFRTRLQQIADGNFRHAEKMFAIWWLDGHAPPNVWLGVSVENQSMADLRILQLLEIPAAVRFLSCEPLLEKLEFGDRGLKLEGVDWVIVGGESGKDRRDCGVDAIIRVAEQCRDAGVPVYVKQDCAFHSGEQGRIPDDVWGLKQFPRPGGDIQHPMKGTRV